MAEIDQIAPEENEGNSNNLNLPTNQTLIFQNVSFQYQGNKELVLKNISIEIPENKTTAIVGHSGCGKTTLLRLLLRFYQPSYGEITLGNLNLNSVSLSQWRKSCAAVLQDGRIYNDSILNNIALEDENIDYEKLKQATQIANIEQEIVTLPLGYQTRIGETGRGLSHGQKQRILLARAIYQNPQFLVLDEATSALDSENEDIILTHLETFFENRTVVIAAHRLSTFKRADQIIVLQNGQIAEIGKHDDLILMQGVYFRLIKPQLSQNNIGQSVEI